MMFTHEDFQKADKIGEGSFANVYKGINMKTGETVAIKEIDLEVTEEELIDIQNEISVLRRCSSLYITKIFGSFVVESKLWIVMEYVGVGTIQDLLRPGFLEEKYVAIIAREILKGLEYLHSCDLIHRDLKVANILINHECQIKLGDFGVCGEISDTVTRRHSFVGTPIYMSPEVIMQKEGYSTPSDIWSLGICAIEMAAGRPPYWRIPPQRVIFMIPKNDPPSLDPKKNYSREFRDFVRKCLRKDPKQRPTAKELLNHPFITKCAKHNSSLQYVIQRWEDYKEKNIDQFVNGGTTSEDDSADSDGELSDSSSSGEASDSDSFSSEDDASNTMKRRTEKSDPKKRDRSSNIKKKKTSSSSRSRNNNKSSSKSKSSGRRLKSGDSGNSHKNAPRIFWDWEQEKVSVLPQNQVDKDLLREMNESRTFDINRIGKAEKVRTESDEEEGDLTQSQSEDIITGGHSDDEEEEEGESSEDESTDSSEEDSREEESDYAGGGCETIRRHATPQNFEEFNIVKKSQEKKEKVIIDEPAKDKFGTNNVSDSDSSEETEEKKRSRKILLKKERFERLERLRAEQRKKLEEPIKAIQLNILPIRVELSEKEGKVVAKFTEREESGRKLKNEDSGDEFQFQTSSEEESEEFQMESVSIEAPPVSSFLETQINKKKKKVSKRSLKKKKRTFIPTFKTVESSIPQEMLSIEIDGGQNSDQEGDNSINLKSGMMKSEDEKLLALSPILKPKNQVIGEEFLYPPIRNSMSVDSTEIFEKIILPSIEMTCDGVNLRDMEAQELKDEETMRQKEHELFKKELISGFKRKEGQIKDFSILFIKNLYYLLDQHSSKFVYSSLESEKSEKQENEESKKIKREVKNQNGKKLLDEISSYGIFSKRKKIEVLNTEYLESNLKKSLANVFFERWKKKIMK